MTPGHFRKLLEETVSGPALQALDVGDPNLVINHELARGGFAIVYEAAQPDLGRQVAVKVLPKLTNARDRRRFETERLALGRLSQCRTNVVTVYSCDYTTDGRPYLVMELMLGGSLAEELKLRGRLPWGEVVDCMIPITEALTHAHTLDPVVLHRDIKPENILLNGKGEARLADFGLARLRDSAATLTTRPTASWLHAPPETLSSVRDERSDLYSLCSTLYTLISGRGPLPWIQGQGLSAFIRRIETEIPPPLKPSQAPEPLAQLVQRGLAKHPDQRPQTALELKIGLVRIRANSDNLEPRGDVHRKLPAAHTTVRAPSPPPPPFGAFPVTPPRRSPAW